MTTPELETFARVVVPIADIIVPDRIRQDLGDLRTLAASIEAVGLIHPIAINGDWKLIDGERRLTAYRDILGKDDIEVTFVDITNVLTVLQAEWDCGVEHLPFTPAEAERARERRSTYLAEAARVRHQDGAQRGGQASPGQGSAKLAEPSVGRSARETRKLGAAGTGYSGSTLDKVQAVREVAEAGVIRLGDQRVPAPAAVREVARRGLDELGERGASVDAIHKRVAQAISENVEVDAEEQARRTVKRWRDALAGLRPFREFDISALPGILSEQEWAAGSELLAETRQRIDEFHAVRPSELRVVRSDAS